MVEAFPRILKPASLAIEHVYQGAHTAPSQGQIFQFSSVVNDLSHLQSGQDFWRERLLQFLEQRGRTRPQEVTTEDLEAYRLNLVEKNFADKTLHVYLRIVP